MSIAGAKLARVGSGLVAPDVGLHNVDGRALRSDISALGIPAAVLIVELDKVDTGSAGAVNFAEIHIESESATEVIVPVRPVGRFIVGVVKHEGAVVLLACHLVLLGLARPTCRLNPLFTQLPLQAGVPQLLVRSHHSGVASDSRLHLRSGIQ